MDHFNLARSLGGREKWGLTYVEGTVNEEAHRDAVDSVFHPDDRRLWRRVQVDEEGRDQDHGVKDPGDEVVRGLANILRGFDGGRMSVCDALTPAVELSRFLRAAHFRRPGSWRAPAFLRPRSAI